MTSNTSEDAAVLAQDKPPTAKVIWLTNQIGDERADPDRVLVVLNASLDDVQSGAIGIYREVELRSPTDAHGTSNTSEDAAVLAAIRNVVRERLGDAGGGMDLVSDVDTALARLNYVRVASRDMVDDMRVGGHRGYARRLHSIMSDGGVGDDAHDDRLRRTKLAANDVHRLIHDSPQPEALMDAFAKVMEGLAGMLDHRGVTCDPSARPPE